MVLPNIRVTPEVDLPAKLAVWMAFVKLAVVLRCGGVSLWEGLSSPDFVRFRSQP